jgi:hypothetical protein
VVLPDQRGEQRYLRAAWHAPTHSVVLSFWAGDVCTATARLGLDELPHLVGLLVASLYEAASSGPNKGVDGGDQTAVRSALTKVLLALRQGIERARAS